MRRPSIVLVPVTAAKFGTVVDQLLQLAPLSVVNRYSSAVAPAPPVPATILTFSIWPGQTMLSVGTLVRAGETGSATTLQLTWFVPDTLHPVPVAVRWLRIILVPATAAKFGIVGAQALHVVPPSVEYWYSSAVTPAPPVPGVVMLIVSTCPLQTVATAGIAAMTGATGWADTTQFT